MRKRGKLTEAEAVLRPTVSIQIDKLGEDHMDTLASLGCLGLILEDEGKWAEAETMHRKALALWRKRAGYEDPQTLWELDRLVRVLVEQKRFGEAEQLLDEALTPSYVGQRPSTNLLTRRVDLMGRQGRWKEAAADAALLVQYQHDAHYCYHELAALLVMTHNHDAYKQLCRKILETFANTRDAYVAERMAKDCLLLPDSGVDLSLVDRLTDIAVTVGSGDSSLSYFQTAKAMSSYRNGRFAEAVEWGEKAVKSSIVYANAHAYAILAMAHWQLGHKDTARAMLAKGDSLTPSVLLTRGPVDLGDSWVAWLFARISLDEATALIQPSSPIQNNVR
jgi:tetratricopeptide (TPR) repeat protein